MTSWSQQIKNSTTFSSLQKFLGGGGPAGTPIGLLLALTYSGTGETTSFSNQTKNTTSFSSPTKNSTSFSNRSKNTTTFTSPTKN